MTKKEKQKQDFYRNIAVYGKDEHGEFITYHAAFGNVKDYSPWIIEEYKKYNNMEA